MKGILLFILFSFSVAVAACSGGDGGTSNGSAPSAASTERIVYLANRDNNEGRDRRTTFNYYTR